MIFFVNLFIWAIEIDWNIYIVIPCVDEMIISWIAKLIALFPGSQNDGAQPYRHHYY